MSHKATEITPWDKHFEPSPAAAITASPPPSRAHHLPLDAPYVHNRTPSELQGTTEDQNAEPERPATAFRLSSCNSSHRSTPSTSTKSSSSERNKSRHTSRKSRSDSISSAGPSCNVNVSGNSASTSEKSKSEEALEVQKKKRGKGFLEFLTVKEPSTKAFEEFAELQRRELKEKGLERPFGISSKGLPPEVPKVNSKWDGLPDDKRDNIKAMEKWRKKEQEREKRRPSFWSENQEDEMLYVRYYSPEVPPSRRSHGTRPSTSTTFTSLSTPSGPEAYKTCDPKFRGPRARSASEAPSLADAGNASCLTDDALASPMGRTRLNRSPSLGSLPEVAAHTFLTDDGLTHSDSDTPGSPEDWMPHTPSTPPPTIAHGYRKYVPIILPLTSPLEESMHNVAPLSSFVTDTLGGSSNASNSQPSTSLTKPSIANTHSAFAAGEAQEIDFASKHSEGYDPQDNLSAPNPLHETSETSADVHALAVTVSSSLQPESRRLSSVHHIHGHSDGSNSLNPKSDGPSVLSAPWFKSPKERFGRVRKVNKTDTIVWTPREAQPPSPPPEEPSLLSTKKSRRSWFGKK